MRAYNVLSPRDIADYSITRHLEKKSHLQGSNYHELPLIYTSLQYIRRTNF